MNERTKKSWEGKEDHDTSQKLNIYSMYTQAMNMWTTLATKSQEPREVNSWHKPK